MLYKAEVLNCPCFDNPGWLQPQRCPWDVLVTLAVLLRPGEQQCHC